MDGSFLIPALIVATIGFVVGILAATLAYNRQRSEEEGAVDAGEALTVVDEALPAAAAEADEAFPADQYDSLVHLYRTKADGKLVVVQASSRLVSSAELDEQKLHSLRETAESWCRWLGMAAPQMNDTPVHIEVAPFRAHPEPAVVAAVSDRPRATSVVGQIDEVLQEMLNENGMETRSIHLAQDPTLGVVVWVGTEHYAGIDEVPDEEIRRVIKAAVKKWETTHLH